jgi:YidC/Oxa1 family membrane protein insertase
LKQLNVTDDPFMVLESSQDRSYVAQSGLIGTNGIDSAGRAVYRTAATNYRLADNENTLVVDLIAQDTGPGVRVIKRYTFARDSYLIDVGFIVENQSTDNWQANAFGQIKRDGFDDPSSSGSFMRTYLGFVTTSDDDAYIKIEFDDIDEAAQTAEMSGGWIGFSQHYFLSAWIPDADTPNRFTTRKNDINEYFGEFTSAAFTVGPGTIGEHTIQFYAGPKDQYALAEMSPNLDLTIDYGFLWFLAAPIYWLLTGIDSVMGNYGVSIILLTILMRALFFKLSDTQYKSMAGMRRVAPKMQQLKERYGDDRAGHQKAMMDLYKKENINMFGGCLPILMQMPVFIALYWVLLESVELRHAPFIGWLTDLSVRDPFFVLPLLMGATMFLQTKLSPAPADPMQAKVMQIMPIMMTVLFLWFPAGLVLYWFTNALLGILQQWYTFRKIEAAYEAGKRVGL